MSDKITNNKINVHIRWMIRRDMPEVTAIEHSSFEFPWCEEEYLLKEDLEDSICQDGYGYHS